MNKTFSTRYAIKFAAMSLAVLAAGLLSHRTWAQSPGQGAPYTLDQCIAYAMRNQKNIENARFDVALARAQVREFKGIGLPQASASASFQQAGDLPVTLIDIKSFPSDPSSPPLPDNLPDEFRYTTARFGVKYNLQAQGQVTQLIFDGSFFVGLQAAKAFVDLNEVNVERSEVETAVAVTQAYYGALVNEERAQLLTANLERLEKLLSTTQAMYEQGFVEKVDVDRLTIARNNLRVERQKIARMVDMGYNLLKFQMGMPLEQDISLVDDIQSLDQVPPLSDLQWEGNYHEDRIEMELMRRQVSLNELDLKRYRVGTLGSLVAFGNLGYNTARPRFFDLDLEQTWFWSSSMGLSYNITLFDGFQRRSKVEKSQIEISKIRNNMSMFENAVEFELRNAVTGVLNAWDDVENARANKELAEEVYRIATTKYQQGVGTNLEVVEAESQLTESQVNYLSAIYDYKLAQIELARVKGEITPPSDPAENSPE